MGYEFGIILISGLLIVLMLLVAYWAYLITTSLRMDRLENALRNRVDRYANGCVTLVNLTRSDVRVFWPECKVPYFSWRVDREGPPGTYVLTFGYPTGLFGLTVMRHVFDRSHLCGVTGYPPPSVEEDVVEHHMSVVTYCRQYMQPYLTRGFT